ncbi:hypothetical protein K474DRAFT_1670532 [Panus rudis PR-1116 ss-1]|nr:hypothetical protein K474DRAFT_1670532 [Panus rudis PR-1116 ss-1]
MFRTAFTNTSRRVALASTSGGARAFHASPLAAKSATEKVAEVADKVNKSVGKGLASTIEKTEQLAQKTKEKKPTETVKEVADNVNKSAGRGLASAIEKGEELTEKTKETLGAASSTASSKAKEGSAVAGQKANQAAAGARVAKEDFKNEVRK